MTNNKSRESLETVTRSASEKDMRHIRRRARAKNVDTVERDTLYSTWKLSTRPHTHNIIKRNKKKNRNYLFRV